MPDEIAQEIVHRQLPRIEAFTPLNYSVERIRFPEPFLFVKIPARKKKRESVVFHK